MGAAGKDFIGVGVGAMIFRAGRVFLAQRGEQAKNERGCWEFPGGQVQFGETLADALRREIYEEYGIEISLVEQLGAQDHLIPAEGQHWVSVTFIAVIAAGEPQILETKKCAAIGWFALDALPQPLSLVSVADVQMYTERYGLRGEW
jgi:8-oxo-dGTP diphosphatase